jgi:hypothetical protein
MPFGLISKKKEIKIKNWFLKYLVFLITISGITTIYISTLLIKPWDGIFEKAGLAVLSSGVFAAVLKSLQFQGVFREEIEKIILGTKFIEKRTDLDKLWKKVSLSIYEKKFPRISTELNKLILKTYLPTKHEYYYEDFTCTIKITNVAKNGVMQYIQKYSFDVILAKGNSIAELKNTLTVDKTSIDNTHKNERIYYKVNGINILKDAHVDEKEDELEKKIIYTYTAKSEDKKRIKVEVKEERSVCIKNDNVKLFRSGKITKKMDVSISYPKNLNISFFNIGLVHNFEKNHEEHDLLISRIHKKGLILPHQGFGITFVQV